MGIELQQKQNQNLSARMIQSAQVLQMTSQELEVYLDELSLENPAMDVERGEQESLDERISIHYDREQFYYRSQRQNNDDDADLKEQWNIAVGQGETLQEHLWSQLDTKDFSPLELALTRYLLDCLDDRGYLSLDPALAAKRFRTGLKTVERLIGRLQTLEPVGVCARDLGECLRLQLLASGQMDDNLSAILDRHLEQVAKNKYAAIAGALGITTAEAAGYGALLRSLDPSPGGRFFAHNDAYYVVPDVWIVREGDGFSVTVNRAREPVVRVNGFYRKLSAETDDKEVQEYLTKKIGEAEWVSRCIAQRTNTMQKVAGEILRLQMDFFIKGQEHLHSMKIADVAQATLLHESTISRAINNKYLQCDYGLFPMSYFFQRKATSRNSRSVAVQEQDFTGSEIRAAIRKLLQTEPHAKPFSDRVLTEKLAEKGISISRRTVAKYREECGIPDASGRKSIYAS